MKECIIKIETPLEINLHHHTDDRTAILMGKFSFDLQVRPDDDIYMKMVQDVLEMLPNKIDVYFKEE